MCTNTLELDKVVVAEATSNASLSAARFVKRQDLLDAVQNTLKNLSPHWEQAEQATALRQSMRAKRYA